MSNFTAPTKHPRTGKVEKADWLDNYFGPHHYGVRFPDGQVFDANSCKIEREIMKKVRTKRFNSEKDWFMAKACKEADLLTKKRVVCECGHHSEEHNDGDNGKWCGVETFKFENWFPCECTKFSPQKTRGGKVNER